MPAACASTATPIRTTTSPVWRAGASTTCPRPPRVASHPGPRFARASRSTASASSSTAAATPVAAAPPETGGGPMPGRSLKGTKSLTNLKEAFAGESQANRRYLYFARVADIEGFPDVAGLFKDTADAETGHAFGHLDFLKE